MIVDRRAFLAGAAAAAGQAPAIATRVAKEAGWYRNSIIVDGLGGLSDPYAKPNQLRLSDRAWAEIRMTGVTAARETLLPVGNHADAWEQFSSNVDQYQKRLVANSDRLRLVERASDIHRCKSEGRIGIILGTQDTAMIGPALDRLRDMKNKGVRCVQLTYNLANLSGDGSIEPRNTGLTNLGRATIRRIEAEKLLLDLSHGGARTIEEAVAFSERPLTISHTGARAITDHPRNVSDGVIRAVARKGGVVGVYFMPYLAPDMHTTGAMLLDHIVHVANVAGEDHVAIGTDGALLPVVLDEAAFEHAREDFRQRQAAGIAAPGEGPDVFPLVREYNSIDKLQRLGTELIKRGWNTTKVEKLLGLNLVRLYHETWDE